MASIIQLVGDNKEYVFKSVQIADAGTENGSAISLGHTVTGNKDVYMGVKPTTATLTQCYGLVAKEFIKYVGNEKIDEMTVNANEIVKVVIPQIGQEVVFSNDVVTTGSSSQIQVDDFVSPTNGDYKLVATSSQTADVVAYRIVAIHEPIRVGQRTVDGFRVIRVA